MYTIDVNIYATHFLKIFMFPHFCRFKFECYRNRHSYNIWGLTICCKNFYKDWVNNMRLNNEIKNLLDQKFSLRCYNNNKNYNQQNETKSTFEWKQKSNKKSFKLVIFVFFTKYMLWLYKNQSINRTFSGFVTSWCVIF